MRIRRSGALLLVPALVGGAAGAADSALSATSPPLPAAILPPQLQALEQKMEQLQVSSERYAETASGTVTASIEKVGKGGKRSCQKRRVSLHTRAVGDASISPPESEVFTGNGASTPSLIAIGPTLYFYSVKAGRRDGGRPWVRFRLNGASASTGVSFPYHGQSDEVDAGGTGSYAGLINLIGTATGEVHVVGPASVDGQQTTEFTAVVNPLRLVKGFSAKELAEIERHVPSEGLDVFVTESGLPIRVIKSVSVKSASLGSYAISQTTDILAVNIPVNVKRPPIRRTISESRYFKLFAGKGEGNPCGIVIGTASGRKSK